MTNPQQVFDELSQDYDGFIHRAVGRYDEMFWAALYYLPTNWQPAHICELGCGTGNLTQLLIERWPNAKLTLVDISGEMLEKVKARFAQHPHLTPIQASFETLSLPENTFDLIISNLAIHHILDNHKADLFKRIHQWLQPGGYFVLSDQLRSMTTDRTEKDWELCANLSRQKGSSEAEIQYIYDHVHEVDNPSTPQQLLDWLAHFKNPEIVWRYGMWSVFYSQK